VLLSKGSLIHDEARAETNQATKTAIGKLF
jgi:hypothetical protein